jgi:uncharacterized protein (UPF0333 family)
MRKTISIKFLLSVLATLGFISCKTYYVPIDSFKAQFDGIDSTKLILVQTRGPAGDIVEYLANPLLYINCVDKNNNQYELKNSPSIEIRFTENNNKRTVFYFDRVYLHDTLICGVKSRFIGLKDCISFHDLELIEVQDGRKNFKYVDKKRKQQ